MLGPDGFGGLRGGDGEITAGGGAKVGIIASWAIRRSGSWPDGSPKLRFMARFSWANEVLLRMCGRGELKPRVRIFMQSAHKGKQQIDIVKWDDWRLEGGALILENVMHFETEPLGIVRGRKDA